MPRHRLVDIQDRLPPEELTKRKLPLTPAIATWLTREYNGNIAWLL
jgi:hypothetical protein